MDVDRNGWASFRVAPLPVSSAYTLLAPDPSARVDIAVWAHKARTFFGVALELLQPKAYPNGEAPAADAAVVLVQRKGRSAATRVLVVTVPVEEAPEARVSAEAGAAAIGGAGMDVLVQRGRRVWQVSSEVAAGDDPDAPLALAAILASILLAPIVPPGGGTIFGVKGARERLGLA
ncbi:hypothetical protein [Polyangium jinanense]|uniref:Uncharacterized protein n=1 Tax=Polyangium jinanense TaxID=2829994 RepID=A0A9X4ATG7_9BACT|nr:hypothetical protein [Polyangium jinanense]MDC3954330.1 hypothetical protein [Polyangium jinanense]MDC3984218.1 hypothetical protein [Polyangium jinanense]